MGLKFRRKIQVEDVTFGSISTQVAFKAMKAPRKRYRYGREANTET